MNPRSPSPTGRRRINWQNVLTVVSAAILIGAEVFGAAFAGGWAVASSLASNGLDLGATARTSCRASSSSAASR